MAAREAYAVTGVLLSVVANRRHPMKREGGRIYQILYTTYTMIPLLNKLVDLGGGKQVT